MFGIDGIPSFHIVGNFESIYFKCAICKKMQDKNDHDYIPIQFQVSIYETKYN